MTPYPLFVRVTKYDPARRAPETGYFLDDDWTCISDIGKRFSKGVLSYADYLRAEDGYVESVRRFMEACNLTSLMVTRLYGPLDKNFRKKKIMIDVAPYSEDIKEREIVEGKRLEAIVRLCLRKEYWCELRGPCFRVRFGFDYYMYIYLNQIRYEMPEAPNLMFFESWWIYEEESESEDEP